VKEVLPKKRWEEYFFQEGGGWMREISLLPLLICSWIYGVIVRLRITFYRKGIFKTRQLPCKVISVGNITVGGAGKTPLVAALAKELRQRGLRVAILSRGYKGTSERTGGIVSDGEKQYLTPAEAGDEPFMLASQLPEVPVLVGRKRYAMGIKAGERFALDVVILDDGFQHLGVKRDVDLVLIDAHRGFGNGHLFPRGPVREPLASLGRASLIVLTKAEVEVSGSQGEIQKQLHRYAPGIPLYHSRYKPLYLHAAVSGTRLTPDWLHGKKVIAFAGIADPRYFFSLVRESGTKLVGTISFPDHYHYEMDDLVMLRARSKGVDAFVTTEKDFVKLQQLPLKEIPLYSLAIEHEVMEKEFYSTILSFLRG
jgi:tetraacyldisaccharide 4'-kinase